MKTKKKKLEVDFIGGQGALTKSEEDALSVYFKNKKTKSKKIIISPNKKSNNATA